MNAAFGVRFFAGAAAFAAAGLAAGFAAAGFAAAFAAGLAAGFAGAAVLAGAAFLTGAAFAAGFFVVAIIKPHLQNAIGKLHDFLQGYYWWDYASYASFFCNCVTNLLLKRKQCAQRATFSPFKAKNSSFETASNTMGRIVSRDRQDSAHARHRPFQASHHLHHAAALHFFHHRLHLLKL
jgi:uncharacterized membrane protein YphA (DoxX/SURF4 family)